MYPFDLDVTALWLVTSCEIVLNWFFFHFSDFWYYLHKNYINLLWWPCRTKYNLYAHLLKDEFYVVHCATVDTRWWRGNGIQHWESITYIGYRSIRLTCINKAPNDLTFDDFLKILTILMTLPHILKNLVLICYREYLNDWFWLQPFSRHPRLKKKTHFVFHQCNF